MSILWVSNSKARTAINDVRKVIGRPVTFNTVTLTECTASGCSLNVITNTSTNPYCPICSGDRFIESYNPIIISGHITWGKSDVLGWSSNGQFFDGDCRIQIEYTIDNLDVVDRTDHIVADGKILEIKKYVPRGFQELNRIILECVEKDKE